MDRPTHFDTHGVFVGASHGNVVQVQEYLTRFESIPDTLELDHVSLKVNLTLTRTDHLYSKTHSLYVLQLLRSRAVLEFHKEVDFCAKVSGRCEL